MISTLLAGVLTWFLGSSLSLLDIAVPQVVLDTAATGFGHVAELMGYGPVGLVGAAILFYIAVDTGLNAFVFAISTYRLIPLKGT